jgi:hypothetical protein
MPRGRIKRHRSTYRRVIVRFATADVYRMSILNTIKMQILLHTSKIKGHTERCAQFIIACISFADRGIRIIYTRKHARFAELRSYGDSKTGTSVKKNNNLQTSWMRGLNSSLALNGTIKTLVGATRGGRERTWTADKH